MAHARKLVIGVGILGALLVAGLSVYAQVNRPYHDGSVWEISLIRMKPGMESAYLTYLTTDWKKEQEAMKKAGLSLSYRVITSDSHGPNDWNVMLMTEFKDLATMEANQQKGEALAQQLMGGDEKMRQGYKDRLDIREILADRLAREIVLEPRSGS
jgi:hypothetical protein